MITHNLPLSSVFTCLSDETRHDILLQAAHQLDFEGVVAKRLLSKYHAGKRSRDWQKQRFIDYPTGFGRRQLFA